MVRVLPQESVVRYVHQSSGAQMVKISAGDIYVAKQEEQLTTVLGSCVAVCLRHPRTCIGGMNHFMLPGSPARDANRQTELAMFGRYGQSALEALARSVLACGGRAAELEAKVFGGAKVIELTQDIGAANAQAAANWLRAQGIPIAASDVGGEQPRKIVYDPSTGVVQLQRLRSSYRGLVVERERTALDQLLADGQSS